MHARTSARDAYGWPERIFRPHGDIAFASPIDAQHFCDAFNVKGGSLPVAEAMAMSLLHEVAHRVIQHYRRTRPGALGQLLGSVRAQVGDSLGEVLRAFVGTFPTPPVYRREDTPEGLFAREGLAAEEWVTEELLLLWLANQNPAYDPVRPVVTDADLPAAYRAVVEACRTFFASDSPFGEQGESLLDVLLAPMRHAPGSALAQLAWIQANWGDRFDLAVLGLLQRLALPAAIQEERERWRPKGPGPGAPQLEAMRFGARALPEERRYSIDTDWMPRVVLLAKSVYVWLGQLSRAYGREIRRLDQIPDEELARLGARGFSGLWLIGVFERSRASRRVKQMRGDGDALASAYSLQRYDVADELGGEGAWKDLRDRAARHGVRLAADMVPNHVAIDADWVVRHPDWFIQTPVPPFPVYKFTGADLSEDARVGVFLEDGYWSHTDASVVFRRLDRYTGAETFIYHGNDGTSMPWNDTAQLDYTKPEVRYAVIQTILHVARMFPIIRFDAAMTLAKRHYQRLWFPLPGHGSDIPSRGEHAMTQEEFDARMPVEFWREVVDTVAREAPGTLLLAEAFWLMEGYFVRTLGMHRVYNSAFMNMLKREENAKYRETIKNVLDFDPHILERFVSFMSNPDEETAIEQFGDGDKYFGVCTLMATLPGLPMFAHGQVEGLREKYGMEYARAKWDETANEWLVARHEREIFPLLRQRHLYSGVQHFALYDFETDGGVNEDVFAFSNRVGDERALVVYHNKYAETRGRVQHSAPARGEDGALHTPALVEALALPVADDAFVILREATRGLEWLRSTRELADQGLTVELHAFECHVFTDFRVVHDTAAEPWRELARALGGGPVPSVDRSLAEVRHGALHTAIAWAIGNDEPAARTAAALARGVGDVRAREGLPGPDAAAATAETLRALAHRPGAGDDAADAATLRAWAVVRATRELLASLAPEADATALLDAAALERPLREALTARGVLADDAAARADAALLLSALPAEMGPALLAALDAPRGHAFLGIHAAGGEEWLNQERWDCLVRLLVSRRAVLSDSPAAPPLEPVPAVPAGVREARAAAAASAAGAEWRALGEASGWRTAALRTSLRDGAAASETTPAAAPPEATATPEAAAPPEAAATPETAATPEAPVPPPKPASD